MVRLAITAQDLTEKDFSTQVYDLARATNWLRYHTYRSKKSPPGFPDETLARERVVFLELKREDGKPSQAQKAWLAALLKAGGEAYIARPSDLEDLALVLTQRKRYGDFASDQAGERARAAADRLHRRTLEEATA